MRVAVVGAALLAWTGPDGQGPPRVLASRRLGPPRLAGRWEFPGGKVEAGESDEQALRRELREELAVEATVHERIGPEVPIGATAVLRVYRCQITAGQPALVDHDAHRWLTAAELDEVPWIEVDRPVVDALRVVLRAEPGQVAG